MSRRIVSHRKLKKNSIGDLRNRIIIQARSINAPLFAHANFHQQFTEVKQTWSKVDTLEYSNSGEESFNKVDLTKVVTHIFTIRYDASNVLTAENFVEWRNNYYKILKTRNPEERNNYQELHCNLLGDKDHEANH